jgi:hypothetical protein
VSPDLLLSIGVLLFDASLDLLLKGKQSIIITTTIIIIITVGYIINWLIIEQCLLCICVSLPWTLVKSDSHPFGQGF